jgi:hypothetical protein
MNKRSCYGCMPPERYPGCHDHCPKYTQDKKKEDQIRKLRRLAKLDTTAAKTTAKVVWRNG